MATNIQKFDHLAGKIFADLYESFPVPRGIMLTDYISTVFEVSPPSEDANMGVEAIAALDFYQHTMDWLEKAGFIEVLSRNLMGEIEVVLTVRGLESLKLVPDSLTGTSLGEQLTEAAKAGVLDQIRELTGKVIGAGVSMGTGYINTL
ncbi:hypothetical protein CDR19_25370 [Ectopseudomonas toyotomiensis]|uniref:Uncharacterized protein n=1 Tax=Ectopseudomonas toyotomiensis TaxID=554344 RepID=A0A1I5Z4E7_9GAMM|nr:hypothetical protein [Pseudomonas toyotomiensis]PIA66331.1 hypothetical protein CDR19_25370 [Pseudomonas toyotomiensis]SFQ50987.1 hypothetical protein SAMN05216177_1223 [Pseudomonas toyotomiensis]